MQICQWSELRARLEPGCIADATKRTDPSHTRIPQRWHFNVRSLHTINAFLRVNRRLAYLLDVHFYTYAADRRRYAKGTWDFRWKDALHLAVQNGNQSAIRRLIDCGASLDLCDFNRCTPEHESVDYNDLETFKFLPQIRRKTDPQVRLPRRGTYEFDPHNDLMAKAAIQGKAGHVRELLNYGFPPFYVRSQYHFRRKGVWNPLQAAAVGGDTETVSLLLQHGAHTVNDSTEIDSPIAKAATYGRLEALNILVEADFEYRLEHHTSYFTTLNLDPTHDEDDARRHDAIRQLAVIKGDKQYLKHLTEEFEVLDAPDALCIAVVWERQQELMILLGTKLGLRSYDAFEEAGRPVLSYAI